MNEPLNRPRPSLAELFAHGMVEANAEPVYPLRAALEGRRARAARAERHLAYLEEFATRYGKEDDAEGVIEFFARKHYRQGWEDGKIQGGVK